MLQTAHKLKSSAAWVNWVNTPFHNVLFGGYGQVWGASLASTHFTRASCFFPVDSSTLNLFHFLRIYSLTERRPSGSTLPRQFCTQIKWNYGNGGGWRLSTLGIIVLNTSEYIATALQRPGHHNPSNVPSILHSICHGTSPHFAILQPLEKRKALGHLRYSLWQR